MRIQNSIFLKRHSMIVLALLLAIMAPGLSAAHTQPTTLAWRDTGLEVPSLARTCFDAFQPNVVLVSEPDVGTVVYHLVRGDKTVMNSRPFSYCGPNGLLFALDRDNGTAWRFSSDNPAAQAVERIPTHSANDGTSQAYALDTGRLWASADGGLSWHERAQQFSGMIESLAVAEADARAIYALLVDRSKVRHDQGLPGTVDYTIVFSPNGGVTWEQRFAGQATGLPSNGPTFDLRPLAGQRAPLALLQLTINIGQGASGRSERVLITNNGARSFVEAGTDSGPYGALQFVNTPDGILRPHQHGFDHDLARSTDGGGTWLPFAWPPLPSSSLHSLAGLELAVADLAAANLFFYDGDAKMLWYSPDSGASWQPMEDRHSRSLQFSPYLPLSVVSIERNRLSVLDLPDAGKHLTNRVAPSGLPNGLYFPETRHNLSGVFKDYWEQHGGLAQFGFPRTEPFREVNPADGLTYFVQYFERNRFEYHPELAGTPYEVLLGLLGNQLTETRRAAGESPFNPVAGPGAPDSTFFPATGHTLRGSFKRSWEAKGGLAIYGYPISEEFQEINLEDGKTYIVQYFERNRFEYHPENQGTPYEVLLGLLGNVLLRNKGWL